MMILTEAIQYSYYQSKLDPDTFDRLISIDPTANHRYSRWIVDNVIKHPEWEEYVFNNAADISRDLALFAKYSDRKIIPQEYRDIMKFRSIAALITFFNANEAELERKYQMSLPENDIKKLYQDKTTLLVVPLTHQKSRKYGAGSSWCTARTSEDYYNEYASGGTLYIHRWYLDDGTMDPKKGYQLYIPKSSKSKMNMVELKDIKNEIVYDIDDFCEGIPDNISEFLKNAVEEHGGLNAYQQIEIWCNADDESEISVTLTVDANLMIVSNENYDIADSGDDSTYAKAILTVIGQNSENDIEQQFYSSNFNVRNGLGLFVKYDTDIALDDVIDNASKKWPHAERDRSIDDYDVTQALKKLFINDKIDYIIYDDAGPIVENDYVLRTWLEDYFNFYLPGWGRRPEAYDTMTIYNDNGTGYEVMFRTGYDYSSKEQSSWISTAGQRYLDRQLDLPYSEFNK